MPLATHQTYCTIYRMAVLHYPGGELAACAKGYALLDHPPATPANEFQSDSWQGRCKEIQVGDWGSGTGSSHRTHVTGLKSPTSRIRYCLVLDFDGPMAPKQ